MGILDFLLRSRDSPEYSLMKRDIETLSVHARRMQEWVLYLSSELETLKQEVTSFKLVQRDERLESSVNELARKIEEVSQLSQRNKEELYRLASSLSDQRKLSASILEEVLKKVEELISHKSELVHTSSPKSPTMSPTVHTVNLADIRPYDTKVIQALLYLLNENGKNLLSFQELVSRLYPERNYNQVYSTVSECISRLEARNVLRRTSKGNKTFISFTQEALKQLGNMKLEEYLKKIEVGTQHRIYDVSTVGERVETDDKR
jgi:hypothetical protein